VRSPSERATIEKRRNRVPVALAAVAALVVVATSFPLSVLIGQHRQLSSANAQLAQLRHQNAQLAEQRQQLNSNVEVKRLAQQDYQLVQPGRSLFVILPPAGQTTIPGAPTAGDPANQPLVPPSQAPNMSPDPGLPPATASASGGVTTIGPPSVVGATRPSAGFWSRITSSLEFWK
jgi:cell division protein FtsB